MPRPTHPGPPPPSTAAGKPASYREAQARASGRFQLRTDFTPQGDQAQAIEQPRRGPERGPLRPGASRRHGLRQDLHDREGDRGRESPDPRPLAQQDPGGPALPGVPELLSRERGRVLRVLLRLLPARGLRPADRHVHREGDLPQRGDRQAAPGGLQGPLRAPRRDRRGLGLLHLRPRRPRLLLRHAGLPRGRGHAGDAGAARPARRRCSTSARTWT